jgi:3-methyladenine DNA glycosylase AlkC
MSKAKLSRAGKAKASNEVAATDKMAKAEKGARRINDISAEHKHQLATGQIASKTLVEALSIDFDVLLSTLLPDTPVRGRISGGIVQKMQQSAALLRATLGPSAALARCANHASDTVRGFGAYLIALNETKIDAALAQIRPYATDPHFGVREWAWLALRPLLVSDLSLSIRSLSVWSADRDSNLRRFASEALRQRGVWCSHIDALKQNPELGLAILTPLKADPERYVQDSVANWLNDASKTAPDWTRALCQQWLTQSASAATAYICKRALRSL